MKTKTNPTQLTGLKKRPHDPTALRQGLEATRDELKRAAERLGYSGPNWLALAKAESDGYPCTLDEDEADCFAAMDSRMRARVRALELIGSVDEELRNIAAAITACDQWLQELRRHLAAGPAPIPCNAYINQLEKEVA